MPTRITQKHIEAINKTFKDNIEPNLQAAVRTYFSTRKLQLLYSTPEQLELLDEVMECFRWDRVYNSTQSCAMDVMLKHPAWPEARSVTVRACFEGVHGQPATMWAKGNGDTFRSGYDLDTFYALQAATERHAQAKLDITILKNCLKWVLDESGTFEIARYTFPPIVPILRLTEGMSYIADSIEKVRVNRNLVITPFNREVLQHATTAWAAHELYGSLHGEAPLPPMNSMQIGLGVFNVEFTTQSEVGTVRHYEQVT